MPSVNAISVGENFFAEVRQHSEHDAAWFNQQIWRLRNAIKKAPTDAWSRVALGVCHMCLGQRDQAVEECQVAYGLRGGADRILLFIIASLSAGVGLIGNARNLIRLILGSRVVRYKT